MNEFPTIYCIPGFATDGRIFDVLNLPEFQLEKVELVSSLTCESLEEYAYKFILPQIETNKPFVLCGVSMGGMIAQELSRWIKPEAIVLISSIRKRTEMPAYLRLLKNFPVYKVANEMVVDVIAKTAPAVAGIKNKTHANAFKEMILSYGSEFLKKQAQWCVEWNPKAFPTVKIFHIHGTLDEVFPIWNIKPDVKIKGGNHQMLYFNHQEISKNLVAFLNELVSSKN